MLLDQTNLHCRTTQFRIIFAILKKQILDQNNSTQLSPVHSTGVLFLARVQ